jgi:uncharacterized glyoxalase superfamily protein PhnB
MEQRKKPETLRLRAVMPTLTVNDISASIAWYRDVLGFVVLDEMMHEGQLLGAAMKAGNVEILLGQDDWAQGRERSKGVGFRLYCVSVQDIDQIAADIKARGGKLAHEPTDQPWGARDLAIIDPDGFKISISTGVSEE